MKEISGGYCGGVPPLPIPNREVKPTCADGTAQQCGRVGSRLLLRSEALETEMSSGLFCVYPVFLLCCLRNPFCFILSSFVLSSEFFCVYSVFFPYCLRNRLVLLLPFFRVTFRILLCLFYFSLCCLRSPLFLVLFLFHICIIFVSYLYCLCSTFVRFLFRIYVAFCLDCAMLV